MDDFEVGAKKTYYQVCAYDKPENLIFDVKYFNTLQEAKDFCVLHDNSYVVNTANGDFKCKMAIIRVDSEVISD